MTPGKHPPRAWPGVSEYYRLDGLSEEHHQPHQKVPVLPRGCAHRTQLRFEDRGVRGVGFAAMSSFLLPPFVYKCPRGCCAV